MEEECSNNKMELVHSRTFLVCNVTSVSPFTIIGFKTGVCCGKTATFRLAKVFLLVFSIYSNLYTLLALLS